MLTVCITMTPLSKEELNIGVLLAANLQTLFTFYHFPTDVPGFMVTLHFGVRSPESPLVCDSISVLTLTVLKSNVYFLIIALLRYCDG